MNLDTKTPDKLIVGDQLVLGGSSYKVTHVAWNESDQKYYVTYSWDKKIKRIIYCKATDDLTILLP